MLTATVAIIGSGPIGLWLAYELRSAGIDVLVIDCLPGRDRRLRYSKALSISAGALETFESRGIAKRFLESGIPMKKAHFAGLLLDINTDVLGAQHSCNLIIPQTRTEEILLELCESIGVRLAWGLDLYAITQSEEGVSITAHMCGNEPDTREKVQIKAGWVVGCDGTHSKVRESVGIAFEGTPSTLFGGLADIQLSTKLPGNGILLGKGAWAGTSLVPIGDGVHHRFVSAMGTTSILPDLPTLDQVKELLHGAFGSDFGAHSPLWFSTFGNACRVATSYRAGKVFLAGDAAHQLFPAGGQGMNLGFQDATSLAWRLTMAIKQTSLPKNAVERMLESYSRERHAAAQAVNENVQAQIALMTAKSTPEVALRNVFREAFQNPELNATWARRVTGFGDPTEPYAISKEEDITKSLSGQEAFIGMRATSKICGNGMGELFRATTSEKFVFASLQVNKGVQNMERSLESILKPWASRLTVISFSPGKREGRWQSISALLVRPDMRIAWVATSESLITETQYTLAAVLEHWFGSP